MEGLIHTDNQMLKNSVEREDQVILVDSNDQVLGTANKMKAHQEGLLHRAVSVVVVDDKGRMLLQQRAFEKYHSGGLWTNAACSHPYPGEETLTAAKRRLWEEMGIGAGEWRFLFPLLYKSKLDSDLIEHEYDHVFLCTTNVSPLINPEEVSACVWRDQGQLRHEIKTHPDRFTVWFRLIIELMS